MGTNKGVIAAVTRVGSRKQRNGLVSTFGHLGMRNLQQLAQKQLVDGFDFDSSKETETCVGGKHHRSHFNTNGAMQKNHLV